MGDHDRRQPESNRSRDTAVVTPSYWNFRGEAVLENDRGRRLLVWQGVPGETARGRNQDRAKWLGARKPHPDRVEPLCDRYTPCGGCPLMHLSAEGQRDVRRGLVGAALREEGLEVEVEPVVAAPSDLNFRHLIKLGTGFSDIGRPRIGAFGRDTRAIIPIPNCEVATPTLREVMKVTAHHFLDLQIYPYEPEEGRGLLRYVVARQSAHTGEVLLTLVAGRRNRLLMQLAETIEKSCSAVVGVHLHINDAPGNAIFARDGQGVVGTRRLTGREVIVERVADVDYQIGPGDFFQTHPVMADRLYRDVIELSGARNEVPVVDLYSGVGGFALALAPLTGWALGVESVEGAVRRARASASSNAVTAEFAHGEVVEVLPEVSRRLKGRRPLLIANPARRGLEEGVIEAIFELDPRKMIYVSCNPRALARDLRRFVDEGWSVDRVRPYDMFPNSSHVETVTVLSPPDNGEAPAVGRAPRRKLVR
jgi:23S rRNA (uracil1939-C5)-methyltransferase